jgi:hypothetical protein
MARGQHGQCGQLCLHSHRPSLTSPLHLYTLMKNEDYMHTIQRFVILFYDRTRTSIDVDKARCKLFAKNSNVRFIPLTSAALKQHVRQAMYQGGHVLEQVGASASALPSQPATRMYEPHWTTLPEASKVRQELVSCKCRQVALMSASARKQNFMCTMDCMFA